MGRCDEAGVEKRASGGGARTEIIGGRFCASGPLDIGQRGPFGRSRWCGGSLLWMACTSEVCGGRGLIDLDLDEQPLL